MVRRVFCQVFCNPRPRPSPSYNSAFLGATHLGRGNLPFMGDLPSRIVIRPEQPDDDAAIRQLHRRAFPAPHGEAVATLVARIRDSDRYVPELSLVAVLDDRLVGHVLLSYFDLEMGFEKRTVLGLSPLGVDPDCQRSGVGRALVASVLEAADQMGEPLVVLEGVPAYYPQFGFLPAHEMGIAFPEHVPLAAAQARPLLSNDSSLRGRVVYPEAFDGID